MGEPYWLEIIRAGSSVEPAAVGVLASDEALADTRAGK